MKVSSVYNANISSFAFKHLFSWSFLYDKEYPMLVQILIFYDQEYKNIFLETFLLQNSFLFFFRKMPFYFDFLNHYNSALLQTKIKRKSK